MAKACVVLLADTDTHEAMGRMANALTSAKEFVDCGERTAPGHVHEPLDGGAVGAHHLGLGLAGRATRSSQAR